jgi:hypothetical protein
VEEELADADSLLQYQSQVLVLLDGHGALGIAEGLCGQHVWDVG